MHFVGYLVDVLVDGRGEQLGFLIDDVHLFVDLHLVAENVRVVGDVGEVLVEVCLELVEGFVVAEIGQAVGLLLGGHLRAAEHEDVAVVGVVLRQPAVSRGVVVGDGDDIETPLQSEGDDVLRRHVEVTARRKQRMRV